MNLLDDNNIKKNKKTKAQKIVLTLLIISVILSILIFSILIFLQYRPQIQPYRVEVNGQTYSTSQIGLIETEDGKKMVSLKLLCDVLDLKYFNGEYNTTLEEKNKCYINNGEIITQFYNNSNTIFKTYEKSTKDYEKYTLTENILMQDDLLYINIEDLNVALNLIQYYSEIDNKTVILSPEVWVENNKDSLAELGYEVDITGENIRALSYGYLIIKNNEKYGVITLNNKQIIGSKYNSISFIEYTKEFVVSNNNDKFGIINASGETKIQLQYDDIETLNYEPLLYCVERNGKYGIVKEDGTILSEIKYTSIGYPEDTEKNSVYTLIIPEINSNIPESIIVCDNGKYGLIDIKNGKEIVPCELKGIFLYVNVENNIKEYAVQYEDNTYTTLESHIESLNKIVVNVNE